jgi:hypothetical protein
MKNLSLLKNPSIKALSSAESLEREGIFLVIVIDSYHFLVFIPKPNLCLTLITITFLAPPIH